MKIRWNSLNGLALAKKHRLLSLLCYTDGDEVGEFGPIYLRCIYAPSSTFQVAERLQRALTRSFDEYRQQG